MPGASGAAAVRLQHAHVSRGEQVFRTTSLRTRALVLRHTHYGRLVVDERLLAPVFPYVAQRAHQWCAVLLSGRLEVWDEPPLTAGPGECVLFGRPGKRAARWSAAEFVELEWTSPRHARSSDARKLAKVDLAQARALAAALDDRAEDDERTLRLGLELFRAAGAGVGSIAAHLPPERPTEADLRLARALEAQINDLQGRATTSDFADAAGLSPRQLQRVVRRFNQTYGLDAGNWRDVRNRCRVQLAALLLSLPGRTVAQISREVGYASPNAMARAFTKVGLPSPAKVREALTLEPVPERMSDKDH